MITLFFVLWLSMIAAYISVRPFFRPIKRYPVATIESVDPAEVVTIFGYPTKYRSRELREYIFPLRLGGLGDRPQLRSKSMQKPI